MSNDKHRDNIRPENDDPSKPSAEEYFKDVFKAKNDFYTIGVWCSNCGYKDFHRKIKKGVRVENVTCINCECQCGKQ